MSEVLILSGPPGAGKSSVAAALAERYDRVAILPLDGLHEWITPTGHVRPWGPREKWKRQERLLVRAACALARIFLAERFAPIIDHPVLDGETLAFYIEELRPSEARIHHVRLLPRLSVCQARNAARPTGERLSPRRVETAYEEVVGVGEIAGITLDTSELSVYETADRLQALTTGGESLVWSP